MMNDLEKAKARDIDFEKISIRDGVWFIFPDGEDEIAVHGSGWNGKERIYFNEELVVDKRSFRMCSKHSFNVDGKKYDVEYITTDVLRGHIECVLHKDGVCIDRKSRKYIEQENLKKKGSFKELIVLTIVCFVVGWTVGYVVSYFGG